MNVCILLSAGTGLRSGSDIPKQYKLINGEPLVSFALKKLIESACFDFYVIAAASCYMGLWTELLNGYGLKYALTEGGELRSDSVLRALEKCPKQTKIVAIHDGARPNPSVDYMVRAIKMVRERNCGLVPAVEICDTVKRVDENGSIIETIARQNLYTVQTPQIFPWAGLLNSYRQGVAEGFVGTDDAAYFKRYGGEVFILPGNVDNLKITWPGDFEKFRFMLNEKNI